MQEQFQWQPAYSVNVGVLDKQHQRLISLLQGLQAAVNRGDGPTAADRVFKELIAYTKYHFGEEERLMEQYGFPGLAEHRFEHEVLTRRVLLFKESYDKGRVSLIPTSLLAFLQDWLKRHILVTDKKYSEFLNSHGVH